MWMKLFGCQCEIRTDNQLNQLNSLRAQTELLCIFQSTNLIFASLITFDWLNFGGVPESFAPAVLHALYYIAIITVMKVFSAIPSELFFSIL